MQRQKGSDLSANLTNKGVISIRYNRSDLVCRDRGVATGFQISLSLVFVGGFNKSMVPIQARLTP